MAEINHGSDAEADTPDTGTQTPTHPHPIRAAMTPADTTTPGDTPAPQSDWRAEKYGADWQNSLNTGGIQVKYLRGELDKAKKQRPQRRVEEATT